MTASDGINTEKLHRISKSGDGETGHLTQQESFPSEDRIAEGRGMQSLKDHSEESNKGEGGVKRPVLRALSLKDRVKEFKEWCDIIRTAGKHYNFSIMEHGKPG